MNWDKKISRRNLLKMMGIMGAITAVPSVADAGEKIAKNDFLAGFFQKHYRLMSKTEKEAAIERLKREYKKQYGLDFNISTKDTQDGVKYTYLLDIGRCIGCRRCVEGCMKENNTSRGGEKSSEIQYIKVLKFKKGRPMRLEEGDAYYDDKEVPDPDAFYMPIQCQQCADAPCTKACPTKATWKEKDGVTVVDYNWCIGCRVCMNACPYQARRFNWGVPALPKDEINTETHYLGNRPRQRGVVEKCHFCVQRVREGKYPACHDACPTGVRKFGNLLDPNSEIHQIFMKYKVFRLKEDLNTEPSFYYYSSVG